MPGTNRKMPKKMRGGGMMAKPKKAPVKKMRGGGAMAKPKKAPVKKMRGGGGVMAMKKGGAAVRSSCPTKDL